MNSQYAAREIASAVESVVARLGRFNLAEVARRLGCAGPTVSDRLHEVLPLLGPGAVSAVHRWVARVARLKAQAAASARPRHSARLPAGPCPYRPGSAEKLLVLEDRARLGLQLFHPDDGKAAPESTADDGDARRRESASHNGKGAPRVYRSTLRVRVVG